MFKITKDGATMAMTEAPNYIKRAENGCFILCGADEAEGVACNGTPYHLLGRPDMDGLDTVLLEEVDAGAEIYATQETTNATANVATQAAVAAQVYVRASTTIPDASALLMPDLFTTWAEVLAAAQHGEGHLDQGAIINKDGNLFRVVPPGGVDPLESQPPDGEGMLAVYRPIVPDHAGTLEDPIPYVYGMDCHAGLYYSYEGKTWLCKADMIPCTWAPGTPGVWQWEEA